MKRKFSLSKNDLPDPTPKRQRFNFNSNSTSSSSNNSNNSNSSSSNHNNNNSSSSSDSNYTEEKSVTPELPLSRPPLNGLHSSNDEELLFQLVECDYYIGFPPHFGSSSIRDDRRRRAIVRLFGVTAEGHSVLLHVTGFAPYFYVRAWKEFDESNRDAEIARFRDALETSVLNDQRTGGPQTNKCDEYIPKVSLVKKCSLWGYQFGKKENFLKIYTALPTLVPAVRRLLSTQGLYLGKKWTNFGTYESALAFVLRFMIDRSINGGGWIRCKATKYRITGDGEKTSFCSFEATTRWDHVEGISHLEMDAIAPLRVLSFDIECNCNEGFPDANRRNDKVIQIANIIKVQGSKENEFFKKIIFTLGNCAPIAGVTLKCFDDEKKLLLAWSKFVQDSDCDILTGYNIVNFDLPYLIDRAAYLKIDDKFTYLGRLRDAKTRMKEMTFSSKAYGTSNSKDIKIYGRVQMDLLPIIRRDHKLRSYSLNNVSFHFLKQQKEDVHYSIIGDLQNGSDEDRRRLAVYCLKDAMLPLRLMNKLMILINQIEMARVTGVPIMFLIQRGQQIKVLSQLYRKAMTKDLVIPYRERVSSQTAANMAAESGIGSNTDAAFEGATVIEPIRGYYQVPITTLDFASLYPSIMMAHNLCYTTMLSNEDVSQMKEEDYTKTPTNNYFVKSSVLKGLLPEILEELLAARKKAKKAMKSCKDPFQKAVLNGRQLALKVTCNSVYGFTGATVGSLPCISISASVTGFGREMIDKTKEIVEKHYNTSNGYSHDAQVIYGDTDSVMIKFGSDDMAQSMQLGREAAELVSKHFLHPIELEFEKVYLPYLLMNKKRYAGMLWTKPEKHDYMDAKGIETVRRDNCQLVKIVVQTVLNHILIDRNVDLAQEYAKGIISKLLQNKIDMSLLVITKALGKVEDYKVKAAHVELALKMAKRDAATAPKVGERVAFVFVKGRKGARGYEKAEDPLYALENGIGLDTDYYLHHQLEQPLLRIFEPILHDKVSHLFHGDHTRKISKITSKTGPMAKFTKVRKACLGCKVPLKQTDVEAGNAVCSHCKSRESILYMKQVKEMRKAEKNFHKLWTQCQRCQGSMTQQVLCTNRDCPIFYRRTKARKDLSDAKKLLDQFGF